MSKLYNEQIDIRILNQKLLAFRWRRRWYKVVECSVWMPVLAANGPYLRNYHLPRYRCETDKGLSCDLVRDETGWKLERVWD